MFETKAQFSNLIFKFSEKTFNILTNDIFLDARHVDTRTKCFPRNVEGWKIQNQTSVSKGFLT